MRAGERETYVVARRVLVVDGNDIDVWCAMCPHALCVGIGDTRETALASLIEELNEKFGGPYVLADMKG